MGAGTGLYNLILEEEKKRKIVFPFTVRVFSLHDKW